MAGMRTITAVLAAISPLAPLAPGASAQSVLVEVTATESVAPLAGAFVSLLDAEGQVVRRALTDERGRSVLPVAEPGTYRVRAELIGRETGTSAPFELVEGETERVSLSLVSHALPLSEIRVEVEGRCHLRPDEATEVHRVWDEARKAIAVQAWAEGEGLYDLEISTYDRDLDAEGRRVERENRRGTSVVSRVPFASLPPEELVEGGFVRRLEGGGHEYYGPDATVLLSDPFLDSHCFRLARSAERPGQIGLAFEPVEAGERADVRGTFWLDEETAALRLIEYRYTWAPYPEAEGIAGGRVEFEALPDGAWMIERWSIRAPLVARRHLLARGGASGIRVIGIRETGGEVLGVSTLDRRLVSRAERGSVRGVVWDSTTSAPLAGASVRLEGTAYAAETDAEGRFLLEELPAGVFTATFSHPRLDSLGVMVPGVEAEVAAGRTVDLALAVPSREAILVAACRAEAGAEGGAGRAEGRAREPEEGPASGAVLSGVVRRGSDGEPVPGARVRVEWQEVEATERVEGMEPGVQPRDRRIEVGADEEGRYMVCGVPADEPVRVRALFLDQRGEATEVALGGESYRVLDLEIGLRSELFAGGAVGAAGEERAGGGVQGVQGVQGRLVEHGSGRPVRAAEVILRSGSGRVLATGTTNVRGFFRLQVPRDGPFLLSARALGYQPVEDHAVEVQRGKLTVLDVRLATDAFELDPIVVTAEQRSFHLEMEGFYRRRDRDFGVFITPEELEERRPQRVSDMFFGIAGVRVAEPATGIGGRLVWLRGGDRGGPQICWPMVYVDRHLVSTGGYASLTGSDPMAVDEVVFAPDVLAVEVFRSPAEIPPEFSGPNAGCGVVVLWTRRGGGG